MSSFLREQLNSAKSDYRATRYPGDLAAEVLPAMQAPLPRRGMLLWGVLSVGGIAAAAVVAAMLSHPLLNSPNADSHHSLAGAIGWSVPEAMRVPLPSLPKLPDGFTLAPSGDGTWKLPLPSFDKAGV